MRVFWQEGFEAASIDALCRAMNMPRASLYQRFGDKEGLFLAALAHYGESRIEPLLAALGPEGSLHEDLARFFDAVVSLATGAAGPTGCLISCVLTDAAGTNPALLEELERRFAALEARLAARLRAEPGAASGEPEVQAMLLASVARGIMIRARAGATAAELTPVGRAAAALCPGAV